MSNDFYNASGTPATGSPGASASMRAEFSAIKAAFDKLPAITGNGNKLVRVSAAGTALEASDTLTELNVGQFTATGSITLSGTIAPGVVISGSSTGAALRVTQTGTGDVVRFEDEANPDATPFVIDASGRVLVGDTTARAFVGGTHGLQVNGTAVADTIGVLSRWSANAAGPQLQLAKSRGAALGTHATLSSGDTLGILQYTGSDGTAFLSGARIEAQADGASSAGSMPTRLLISTTPSGSGTAVERLRIDSTGSVGIGTTALADTSLRVSRGVTGGATASGIRSDGAVLSDVTGTARGFISATGTQVASFTLTNLVHYEALQGTFGAGSAVTNQYGFSATAGLTGATNNFGFYSNIASGAGRWNFYANGTAANYFAGTTLFGNATERTASGSIVPSVQNAGSTTGASSYAAIRSSNDGSGPNYILAKSRGTLGSPTSVSNNDQAGAIRFDGFDGTDYQLSAQIRADVDGTPGTGSMPGRLVFSTTPSGSSTPVERMRIDSEGRVGIGTSTLGGLSGQFRVLKDITGATGSANVRFDGAVQTDVTGAASNVRSVMNVAASATPSTAEHFTAVQGTFTGTPASQYGFHATSGLTGATNNYGFYSNIAAAAGRWNFYANGSAENFFGKTRLGNTTNVGALDSVSVLTAASTGFSGHNVALVRYNTDVNGPVLYLAKSKTSTLGGDTAVVSGDTLGEVQYHGNSGSGFATAARVACITDGTPAGSSVPGALAFFTANGAGSVPERMRIDASGSVLAAQVAPAAVNTTATLTVANLRTRIITSTTAAAVTGTLPTGTLMDGLYNSQTDMGYDWSVINTGGTNNFTVAAGTAHTVVGNMVVSPNTSGSFRSRRTAANTWITYRIG
jgi:hypothetical protein